MAISRAQAGNTATGSSTTPSATLTSTPTPGNLVVFTVSTSQIPSASGNLTHVTGDDVNSDVHIYIRQVQPGDSATFSITQVSSAWSCRVDELTGSAGGWAVDLMGAGHSAGAETSHALAVAGPTGSSSTLHSDEMAFAVAGFNISETSVPWNNSLSNDTTNLVSGTRSLTVASRILTATASFSTLSCGTWTSSTATGGFAFFTVAALGPDPTRPSLNPERIRPFGPFKPTRPVDATAVIFGTAALTGSGDLSAAGTASSSISPTRPSRNPERIRPFGPFKPTRPVELHPLTVYGAANLSGSGDLSVDPRFLALDGTSGTWASTPDSVANSITGDIIVRIDVALADWSPSGFQAFVSKATGGGSPEECYNFEVDSLPNAFFVDTSPDGTVASSVIAASTVPPGFTDDTNHWIQWKRVVNDGSGHTVDTFEECAAYNPSDPTSWSGSAIGSTVTTTGTTSIFNGTSSLYIGTLDTSDLLNGRVYRMQLLTGAGTLKVDFRPTDYVSGSTLTSSATGEVWTLGGHAAIQATPLVSSSAALAGAGSLSATGTIGSPAALSGAGSLSAVPTTFGAASLAGAGDLSATLAAVPIQGTAALSGAGDLSVRPADPVICYPTHAIGGTSGVTRATGAYDGVTVALGSSTGVTHADDICLHTQASVGGATGVATLSGAGSLTATGAVGSTVFGGAAISGAGSLSATGVPTAFGVASLAGAGSLSAVPAIGGIAALSGAGSLSASGTLNRAAALSGAGDLSAIPTTFGLASLTGAGSLSATLTQSLPDLVPTGIDWT